MEAPLAPGPNVFAKATYGFEETKLAEGTAFDVTPEPPPWGALVITLVLIVVCGSVAIAFLTGILALMFRLQGTSWLVLTVLAVVGLVWGYVHHMRQVLKLHRPRRIVVLPRALVVDQTTYSREHISHLWVVHPGAATTAEPAETTTVIVGGSHAAVTSAAVGIGLQNLANDTGRRTGQALGERMNRVAHGVSMRYGAQTVPVATGLALGSAVMLEQKLRGCLSLQP